MNSLSNQTKQFRSDLSNLKTKIFGLHSETHSRAPDFEDLDLPQELMDEYRDGYKKDGSKKTTFAKSGAGSKAKDPSQPTHYSELKDQFNSLMKN